MIHLKKTTWVFAGCLSAIAGFVDAAGFIKLGGLFVSFMSGNSTRLAVSLFRDPAAAAAPASLIATFVLGAGLGSLLGHRAGKKRQPAVLLLVSVLLAAAALAAAGGFGIAATAAMVLAMGAENATFEQDGETRIGVTYMTGALVKCGQRLAGALRGEALFAGLPYFLLWGGLVAGAFAGAFAYSHFGDNALWAPSVAAALLAAVAARKT